MRRPVLDLLPYAYLDDLAEIHHGDPIGDVAYDGEVMGDEDVGKTIGFFYLRQKTDDDAPFCWRRCLRHLIIDIA